MSVPNPPEDYTYPEDYVPPPPFPSCVSSMTLHVTKGTPPNEVTYTESIPYASIGENAFALTNQQLIYDFDNKPPGTKYSYHITTNYTPGSFPTGDVITTPTVTNQTVKATPVIDIMSLTYNPAIEEHSILETVNSNSDGQISYTSSNPNVVSIEPGTGKIIAVEPGTAYLTITQSSTPEYEGAVRYEKFTVASGPSMSTILSAEPAWLQLLNNITIRDTVTSRVFQSNLPVFVQEDPRVRGTPEWFAIVNNSSLPEISNYARTLQSQFFTPPGQSTPVPFDNIVTTHVTNMGGMFQGATAFDHDISSWDTSRVTNMKFMFAGATMFDRPLNNWNTSRVIDMSGMFSNAFRFNQNISGWNVSRVFTAFYFRQNSALSSANTPNFIIGVGWLRSDFDGVPL
jgi:surface protein